MKRSEYMDGSVGHREYYGQYVSDEVKALVDQVIGRDHIVVSSDPHFNDIRLSRWDALVSALPRKVYEKLKENGDWLGLMSGVCILKEAAEQIRETWRSQVR